jgi:hypothetical protein
MSGTSSSDGIIDDNEGPSTPTSSSSSISTTGALSPFAFFKRKKGGDAEEWYVNMDLSLIPLYYTASCAPTGVT